MQKSIFGKTKVRFTVTVKLGEFFIRSVFLRLAPTVAKEVPYCTDTGGQTILRLHHHVQNFLYFIKIVANVDEC